MCICESKFLCQITFIILQSLIHITFFRLYIILDHIVLAQKEKKAFLMIYVVMNNRRCKRVVTILDGIHMTSPTGQMHLDTASHERCEL